jgi:hypothetical protein
VGLGNEGPNIDIDLEVDEKTDPSEKLEYRLDLASSSARYGQTYHKIEFCLFEPRVSSLLEDSKGPVEGDVLVDTALPLVHRRLNGEGQARFTDLGKFSDYGEGKTVDFKRGELERNATRPPFGIEPVEKFSDAWVVPRGKRREGYLTVAASLDEGLHLGTDYFIGLDALGPVEIAGMAKTTAIRTAAHYLDSTVVLYGLDCR